MKTRLPKSLLVALMSTMLCATTIASAANVAEVVGTTKPTETISKPENARDNTKVFIPVYVGSDVDEIKTYLTKSSANYIQPVIFDPAEENGKATIENWGNQDTPTILKTGFFVREGELTLQDSQLVSKTAASGHSTCFAVSGKDATLILNNTTFKIQGARVDAIGGKDGSGAVYMKNGSVLYTTDWLVIGNHQRTHYKGNKVPTKTDYNVATAISPENADRYSDGVYTELNGESYNNAMSNLKYGSGTLAVTGGSKLYATCGIQASEANILISGSDSSINTGTSGWSYSNRYDDTGAENPNDTLGRMSNSTTIVLIEKGGKWNCGNSMYTCFADSFETKAHITIDGLGSQLNVDKILGIGYGGANRWDWSGTVGSTEMHITNGGAVTAKYITFGPQNDIIVKNKTEGGRKGANPVYVYVDKDSSMLAHEAIYINNAYNATNKLSFKEGKGVGYEVNIVNEGQISTKNFIMNGGNLYSTGTIDITGEMTLIGGSITLGISEANTEKAAITAGDVIVATADNADYVIQLTALENLKAGKYLLLETEEDSSDTTGTSGKLRATAAPEAKLVFSGLEGMNGMTTYVDETGNVYLVLDEQVLVNHDPMADAIQAANWGVYKSSQAFTSLLWAPRPDAIVVNDTTNGKSSILSTAAKGRTLAWGSVYSSFARHSSSGAFAGAEYSIVGGAIGVERVFACGRSVGAAFGYDWGKTSPFTTSRVDQDSWHAALYGRAAEWKLGKKGSVAIDWSAAVGSTTSEHKALGSDWTQENIQLDARATYSYALTERTALSAFVGAQYYAQNDDSTEKVKADSLQNLRLMLGAGISHKLTEKTTLFGEALIYNDTMRHNPDAMIDGFNYGSGANPGRLGGSVTAGAQYQLTPDWTLRGSYSYEGAEDNNEHRVNVGAVYSF